jgi:hypothetical protein
MFGSIGLALGAVSTVSSLLEAAAAGISQAAANTQPASAATFSAAATTTTATQVQTYGAPKDPGVVVPKFDQRTQAALLAYQEMHWGG